MARSKSKGKRKSKKRPSTPRTISVKSYTRTFRPGRLPSRNAVGRFSRRGQLRLI